MTTNDREKAQGGPQEAAPPAPDTEAIRRARWVQNSANTMILKCCVKDGSAVLARVIKARSGFRWRLWDGRYDTEETLYGAQKRPDVRCGRWGMDNNLVLDLDAIRRAAAEGLPVMPGTVLALVGHIEELESALDYWKGGQAVRDLAEACRQLRAADRTIEQLRIAGLRVLTEIGADDDSSDDVRMLESLCKYNDDRQRAEFPLLDAARAYLDAIDRGDDVAAALSRLRRAVEQTGV